MTGALLLAIATVLYPAQGDVRSRVFVAAMLDRYGRSDSDGMDDRGHRVAALRTLGVGGVRVTFNWSNVEKDRGQPDWSRLDSIVQEVRDAKLKVLGLLVAAPAWARPPGTDPHHRPVVDGSEAHGDTAFARFAAAAASRFRGKIELWEVWNEPNLEKYWFNV